MSLKLGTTDVVNVRLGTTAVTKVMLGSTIIWSAGPIPAKLVFPAVVGNYMTAPDAASLRITGDIEAVLRMQPTSWLPAVSNEMVSRYTSSGLRSYRFIHRTDGKLQIFTSADGTAATSATSTVAIANDGAARWLKMTRVAATGSCNFYTAADAATEPSSWTALGTAVTNTAGNIFAGTSPLAIGQQLLGNSGPYGGRLYRVILRNGIAGTVVFDMHEDNANAAVIAQLTATSGQVVTATVTGGNQIIQPRSP